MKTAIKILLILGAAMLGMSLGSAFGQTHSSAMITQTVKASPAIAAKVTLTGTPNPSTAGTLVTYSGTVTGTNNGASPTGTVTVTGQTGSQTVTLSSAGSYTCSETITKVGAFTITATYSGDSNFF